MDAEFIKRRRKYFAGTDEQVDYMVRCLRSEEMSKMELYEVEKWLAEQGVELKRRLLENYCEQREKETAGAGARFFPPQTARSGTETNAARFGK